MRNTIARSTRKRAGQKAAPARHFDATVGAITAREHVDDALTEDQALTNYLMSAWRDLISPRSTPLPRCPHCDGARIRAERPRKKELPSFFCHRCQRYFNRLTQTPFVQLKNRDKGTAMIPLLSRQMSIQQACERLGRTNKAILSRLLAFRRYLLELNPSGRWEARVRLGVRMAPHAHCLRCGFEGGVKSAAFDPQRRRRIRCPQCGRSRLLDVLQDEGHGLVGVILHDAVDTAVRYRRKHHPDTVVPAVARAAHVDETTLTVRPRRQLADIELPARILPRGPMDQLEDRRLSAHLTKRIDAALSQSIAATRCPWCDSAQTEYHPLKRPRTTGVQVPRLLGLLHARLELPAAEHAGPRNCTAIGTDVGMAQYDRNGGASTGRVHYAPASVAGCVETMVVGARSERGHGSLGTLGLANERGTKPH
ncbi:transposase-like protein [Ralstonia sp. 1138]